MANRYYNIKTNKFNLSRIMKDAWANIVVRNNIRLRLSLSLSVVWAAAKAEKEASLCTNAERNIARLENAIDMTKYLPFGMNQSRRVETLQKELRRAA